MSLILNNNKKLNILQLSVEYYPLAKTGGMAHVVTDISNNFVSKGHNVSVFMPLWGVARRVLTNLETIYEDVPIRLDNNYIETFSCQKLVEKRGEGQLTFYFINHYNFFGRFSKNLYGHKDIHKRFFFLSKAVLEIISRLELKLDVIHLHDWMMGLFPELYKKAINDGKKMIKSAKILLTIHNLAFQGSSYINVHRFEKKEKIIKFKELPNYFNNRKWDKVNFLNHGINNSDMVSTVSGTYAKEILTKEYGEGLDSVLRKQKKVYGIVNGINYQINNPEKSKKIFYNYNSLNVTIQKKRNKIKLLRSLKIKKNLHKLPIFFTQHRLAYQKGFDLIISSFEEFMKKEVILIIMGDGDQRYIKDFKDLAIKYKDRFRFITPFSESLEYKLFAAGDVLLAPSVYEPCGISHLRAMRFGVIPIGRKVGGIADTISNYDEHKHSGTGFLFVNNNEKDYLDSINRAMDLYKKKSEWNDIVRRTMIQSFGWDLRIDEYISLYNELIRRSR